MTKKLTVNLFDVSWTEVRTQSLSHTLRDFDRLRLEDRWRDGVRLDRIEHQPADAVLRNEAIFLDFAKGRDIGPGKLANAEAVSDVGLGDNEFFGEETAALYIPHKKWLVILSNHYGVGPSRMAAYFNALDPGNAERHFDYQVTARLDADAWRRMRRMSHISSVEISANIGAFEQRETALGAAVLDTVRAARAKRLTLTLHANEPHKSGSVLGAQEVKSLLAALFRNSDDVSKLMVKGSAAADAKDQVINLLEEKVRLQFSEADLDVLNHRYTLESKMRLLRRASRGFVDSMG